MLGSVDLELRAPVVGSVVGNPVVFALSSGVHSVGVGAIARGKYELTTWFDLRDLRFSLVLDMAAVARYLTALVFDIRNFIMNVGKDGEATTQALLNGFYDLRWLARSVARSLADLLAG